MQHHGKYIMTDSHLQPIAEAFALLVSEQELFRIPGLTLDHVADRMEIKRAYLSRAVNQCFGKSFTRYINELRIREAMKTLQTNPDLRIADIARAAGFNDRKNCLRVFTQLTGRSPGSYRERIIKEEFKNNLLTF